MIVIATTYEGDNLKRKRPRRRLPECKYSRHFNCRYEACPIEDNAFFSALSLWAWGTPSAGWDLVSTRATDRTLPSSHLCIQALIWICINDWDLRVIESYLLTDHMTQATCEALRRTRREWNRRTHHAREQPGTPKEGYRGPNYSGDRQREFTQRQGQGAYPSQATAVSG